ncbi:hypothetical protein [Comamonas thiooxydans]|uniref:hypothetical protein n=1 Tax=Comamonas thiooxydans TaxID=363952 RepID=UPI00103B70E4|nr:hypothetical protein [Comamonas thiooxydans]TZG07599.1 hypothetical protein FZC30_18545 [Comamonas thiooxydans]
MHKPWYTAALMAFFLPPVYGEGTVQIGAPREWGESKKQRELSPEEKAKAAETKARDDWRKAAIEGKVTSMGEHRRAEAIRLVEMEEAARNARGQQFLTSLPTASEAAPDKRICRQVSGDIFNSIGTGKTKTDAEQGTKVRNFCAGRGEQVGVQMKCSERSGVDVIPEVVDGKARFKRVPKPSVWTCEASYSCSKPKEVCESEGAAKASRGVKN